MAKRRIRPDRAAASVGGPRGWYARIEGTHTSRTACSACGTYSTLIGADGACLKCTLERRKAERKIEGDAPGRQP